MRTLALTLLLTLPASPQEPVPAAAPTTGPAGRSTSGATPAALEAARLDRVERRLASVAFTSRPWLVRECGLAEWDGSLPSFDQVVVAQRLTRLAEADTEIVRMVPDHLPRPLRLDYEWLRAFVRAEMLKHDALPLEAWDAGLYFEEVHQAFWLALEPPKGTQDSRVPQLDRALVQLPAIWDTARRNLRRTLKPFSQLAVEQADELLAVLEHDVLPALELDSQSDVWRKRIQRHYDQALESTREMRTWLAEELAPQGRSRLGIDDSDWAEVLELLTGNERSPEELEVLLLREIAELDRRMGKHRALAARTDPSDLTPGRVVERVRAMAVELDNVAFDMGLAPLESHAWMLRASATRAAEQPLARWAEGLESPGVLRIGLPSPGWEPERAATRAALLSPAGQRALAVRYGPVGEAGLRVQASASDPRTHVALANHAARGGFGLYATDWVARCFTQALHLGDDPSLLAELERQRLLEALRLLTAVQLHVGRRPTELLVEQFELLAGLDAETARREVIDVTRNPWAGASYLAYLEILSLERELRVEGDPVATVRRTLGALLSNTNARAVDLAGMVGEAVASATGG